MDNKYFLDNAQDFINHNDGAAAYKMLRKFGQQEKDALLSDKDNFEIFNLLRFVAIPFLEIKDIIELLTNHLVLALKSDEINITERLKNFFISFDLLDRDEKKDELVKHLINSKQKLFADPVMVEGKKLKSIGDWLSDFIAYIGLKVNVLKEAQYFSKRSASLSDQDKIILKRLFSVYKYLSSSSLDPYGFEDDLLIRAEDGKILTTHNGEIIVLHDSKDINKNIIDRNKEIISSDFSQKEKREYDSDSSPVNLLAKKLSDYNPASLEYRAIKQEIERLRKNKNNVS